MCWRHLCVTADRFQFFSLPNLKNKIYNEIPSENCSRPKIPYIVYIQNDKQRNFGEYFLETYPFGQPPQTRLSEKCHLPNSMQCPIEKCNESIFNMWATVWAYEPLSQEVVLWGATWTSNHATRSDKWHHRHVIMTSLSHYGTIILCWRPKWPIMRRYNERQRCDKIDLQTAPVQSKYCNWYWYWNWRQIHYFNIYGISIVYSKISKHTLDNSVWSIHKNNIHELVRRKPRRTFKPTT